jgi:quercetin dioxygenase-like cupin family protein
MAMPRRLSDDPVVLSDDVVRELAGALAPAELSAERREALRARVLQRAVNEDAATATSAGNEHAAPAGPPPDTETIRGEDIAWRQAWPKVWVKVLKYDLESDFQITLMKFEPGGCIPAHPHRQNEECYVLEGEVSVGSHRVRAGDFHIARAGALHPDLTSSSGALVILRSELHAAPASRPGG